MESWDGSFVYNFVGKEKSSDTVILTLSQTMSASASLRHVAMLKAIYDGKLLAI